MRPNRFILPAAIAAALCAIAGVAAYITAAPVSRSPPGGPVDVRVYQVNGYLMATFALLLVTTSTLAILALAHRRGCRGCGCISPARPGDPCPRCGRMI